MLVRQGFEIISIKLTNIQLRRSINLQPSLYLNKIVPSLELDFVILVFGLKMIRECKLQLFCSVNQKGRFYKGFGSCFFRVRQSLKYLIKSKRRLTRLTFTILLDCNDIYLKQGQKTANCFIIPRQN